MFAIFSQRSIASSSFSWMSFHSLGELFALPEFAGA